MRLQTTIPRVYSEAEDESKIMNESHPVSPLAIGAAALAVAGTMLVLDLTWLGVVAGGIYDRLLGGLKAKDAYLPAAGLFYAMYIAAVVAHAVLGATSRSSALRRGAALGFVCYATYELTNWAVLRDWPAKLVPIDIAWGIVLTAVAALAGRIAFTRAGGAP